jgi:hypothetical protein
VTGSWFGGASRDRTDDLRVANATLSQLSYGPGPANLALKTHELVTAKGVDDGGSGRS